MKQPITEEKTVVPEWVNETPEETRYDLEMYDPCEGGVQDINLSRGEFIALKARLAQMRGLVGDIETGDQAEAAGRRAYMDGLPEGYDLLRGLNSRPSEEQKEAAKRALSLRICDAALGRNGFDLNVYELERIWQFVNIVMNSEGRDTPAEDLIINLVFLHTLRPLTPADVQQKVEEFRERFEDAVNIARRFTRSYPAAVEAVPAV